MHPHKQIKDEQIERKEKAAAMANGEQLQDDGRCMVGREGGERKQGILESRHCRR